MDRNVAFFSFLIFLDVDYGFKKEKSLSFVTQLKKSFAIV
jgi:hypothetical protein